MCSSAERSIETLAKYTPTHAALSFYGVIPVLISTDNAKESLHTACVLLGHARFVARSVARRFCVWHVALGPAAGERFTNS